MVVSLRGLLTIHTGGHITKSQSTIRLPISNKKCVEKWRRLVRGYLVFNPSKGRRGNQHNDIQQNDTQKNDSQQNDTQQNDTQQNDTQYKGRMYDTRYM
jgi:hypothetical protein